LALLALPAATRAFAAFAAAALPVTRVGFTLPVLSSPPSAALIFNIRRLLRRSAALRWIAPVFAARSSADTASVIAATVVSASPVTDSATALLMSVLAADLRGWLTRRLRAAWRTRLIACGVRAPVQVRDE